MQAKYGTPVDISNDYKNLVPGDLLFFGSPEHITHVAIYKGAGEYIHSSGMVMINSLYPDSSNYIEFRRNSLVKAMRILGSKDSGIVALKDHPWY
jgi:cell wall-associated NlpC family hydrolase